jgi:hypothetical protein
VRPPSYPGPENHMRALSPETVMRLSNGIPKK